MDGARRRDHLSQLQVAWGRKPLGFDSVAAADVIEHYPVALDASLRRGLTIAMAADILWLHNDAVLYHQLVHKRQWTPAQFRDWLTHAS